MHNKIKSKLEKYLAMSSSTNENEAAIAQRRLLSLLAEYNLNMSDIGVEDHKMEAVDKDVFYASRLPFVKNFIFDVARLYFCKIVFDDVSKTETKYTVYGKETNRLYVVSLLKSLIVKIDAQSKGSSYFYYQKQDRSYIASFRNSASLTLAKRARELKQEAENQNIEAEEGGTLPALNTLYKQESDLLQDFFHANEITFNTVTLNEGSIENYDGWRAGHCYGDSVGLKIDISKKTNAQKAKRIGCYAS